MMLNDMEIGWLAGIIDGEGYVGASMFNRKGGKSMHAVVTISMTCPNTINKVAEFYDKLELSYFRRIVSRGAHKDQYLIRIDNVGALRKLLTICLPAMVTKRVEAELLIWYATEREKLPYRTSRYERSSPIQALQENISAIFKELKQE